MKYKVIVTETASKIVEVEADNEQTARDKAEQMWFDGKINFAYIDDHSINVLPKAMEL